MSLEVSIHQLYSGHADAIYTLEQGHQAHQLYSGSGDQFIGAWDVVTGIFEQPLAKMPATVYSLVRHPSDPHLLAGLQNGMLFILDIATRKILRNHQIGTAGIFDVDYLPEADVFVAAGGDGALTIISAKSLEVIAIKQLCNKSLRKISVAPCGRFFSVGASDHQVYHLEMSDGKLLLHQIAKAHDSSVFSLTFYGGYSMFTGGRDALLKKWTWHKTDKEWQLETTLPAHNFTVNALRLSPSGKLLASASRDKTIKLWNPDTLELLKVLDLAKYPQAHTHSVNTLHWLNDQTLLSAGDDKRMIGWRVVTRDS